MLRAASLYFHRGLRECFANDMRVYLTVLCAVDWIMMCRVIHLPTFQPPVDGARSLASSPVFYRINIYIIKKKKTIVHGLASGTLMIIMSKKKIIVI